MAGAAAALPWHRSGAVRRTGFELARAADRAGLVTEGRQVGAATAIAGAVVAGWSGVHLLGRKSPR